MVVGRIIITSITKKNSTHNPDTLEYLLYVWGCYKVLLWNFHLESISNVLCGKDDVIIHVMCDLGKTENDKDKYPIIIEDYDKAKKLFTTYYIFVRYKVRENKKLFLETRDDIQKQRRQETEVFRNLFDMVKESQEDHLRDILE